MNIDINYFSEMKWLDELIKERNREYNFYYDNLIKIKNKQNIGIIPYDEYKVVGRRRRALSNVEYGYYMSNIHYDLYYLIDSDELEKRIIWFLDNACDETFEKDSWFMLNFPYDFNQYIRNIYYKKLDKETYDLYFNNMSIEEIIDEIGTEKEKIIIDRIKHINNY